MFPTNKTGEAGIIDYAGRLVINDNVRQTIAEGHAFRAEHHATLAAGASALIALDPSLNAPSAPVYKIKADIRSTEYPINMELYEGATFSAAGTEITIYNFNRNPGCDPSLNPFAKLYHTPTVASNGTKYAPDVYVHAVTGGPGRLSTTAGEYSDEFSAYLNPTKKYLWKFTNIGAGPTRLDINVRIIREIDYKAGGR